MHIRPNSSIKTGGIAGLYNLEIGVNSNTNSNTGSTKYPNVGSNLNSFKNYKGTKSNIPSIGGSTSGTYYNRERESRDTKDSLKNSSSNLKNDYDSKLLNRPLSIQGSRIHGNTNDDNKYFDNNVSSNRYYLQQNYIGKPNQNLNVNIKSVNVLSNSYAFDKPSMRSSDTSYKEKLQTSSFKQSYSPAYLNNHNNSNVTSGTNNQSSNYNDFSSKNKPSNSNYLMGNSKKN